MSNDLYPSNSTIIDLRNKISSMQAPSKTRQFINELHRLPGAPSSTGDHFNPNRTYESERWFSPRPSEEDKNTSLPPRRSMFTPSRLQNLTAQRTRETRKPYWRCPMPTAKSTTTTPVALSNIERILQSSSSSTAKEHISTAKQSDLTVTPAPMKSFVRRREPEAGKKANVFNVDDEELTIEGDNIALVESELANVQPPSFIAPKAGFLTGDNGKGRVEDNAQALSNADFVFTFAEPSIRGPKAPTPPPQPIQPPPKPTCTEKEVQTEPMEEQITTTIDKHVNGKIAQVEAPKAPAVDMNMNTTIMPVTLPKTTTAITMSLPKPIQTTILTNNNQIQPDVPAKILPINQPAEAVQPLPAAFNGFGGFSFGAPAPAVTSSGGFQFGAPAQNGTTKSNLNGQPTEIVAPPTFDGFGGFNFGAPAVTSAITGGFQFGAPPTLNGGGAFQFGGSTSDATDGALSARSGVSARKLLHARRMKKR